MSSAACQEIRVRSGRDDNFTWEHTPVMPNRIVIPTGVEGPAVSYTVRCEGLKAIQAALYSIFLYGIVPEATSRKGLPSFTPTIPNPVAVARKERKSPGITGFK
jgi:hypothetical protein